jgi:hypothetical protein
MFVAIIGKVMELSLGKVRIKDTDTGGEFWCSTQTNLVEGDEGLFIGVCQTQHSPVTITKKVNCKFLNPLAEDDLYLEAGSIENFKIVSDLFEKIWKER